MIIRRALHWYHDGTDLTHDNPAGTTLLKFQSGTFAFQQATTVSTTGLMTLDSGAAINIEPASGSAILLDGTISVDAGVVTGATSITSTAFLGTLDGVVGGNTPAAITGTTIDATTDFTIGTTVITDDSIVMTPSASDTATIAAAANGVLNITTVDAGGATAHMNLTADGNINLTPTGAMVVELGDTYEILLQKGALGSAAADRVGVSAVDTSAGNTSLAVQSEAGGIIYIGSDTVTGASAMTYGTNAGDLTLKPTTGTVVIDQAATDDTALELSSSDIAHGHTNAHPTAVWLSIKKQSATLGGARFQAITEATGTTGMFFDVACATDTTRSATAVAPFMFNAYGLSAPGGAAFGADKNILTIGNNTTSVRFIFDSDGNSHQDVGTAWTAFDDYQDVELLDSLRTSLVREDNPKSQVKENFSKILAYNKESMEAMGLVRYNEDTDGRAFVNMSKLTMLLTSTIVQLGIQMRDAQQSFNDRIESLENKMLQQGGS